MENLTIAKNINFSIKDCLVDSDITVHMPELDSLPIEVSGDWGPNIKFLLSPTAPVKVAIKNNETSKTKLISFDQSSLEFKSPMLKDERDKYPYYLKLKSMQENLNLKITFTNEGKVSKVKINNWELNQVEVEYAS